MIALRLAFYVAYIVLGAVIIARMTAAGLHWESFTGIIFGALLITLGIYRIASFLRAGAARQ